MSGGRTGDAAAAAREAALSQYSAGLAKINEALQKKKKNNNNARLRKRRYSKPSRVESSQVEPSRIKLSQVTKSVSQSAHGMHSPSPPIYPALPCNTYLLVTEALFCLARWARAPVISSAAQRSAARRSYVPAR